MIDNNKKIIQLNLKIKRTDPNTGKEKSLLKLVKNRRTESLPNLPTSKYKENNQNLYNQQNISSNHIQEIHIDLKNLPKEIFDKYIPTKNCSKNNSLPFRNRINNSYSLESTISPKIDKTVTITSESLPYISNNTYTPPYIEMYKAEVGKYKENKMMYKNREREKQSYSMDNTYSKDKTYLCKNDNYNQINFWKKFDNNEYSTYNNSLIMNRTNIEDDSKLNNTLNYNQDKYYCQKNSLTNIKNIPKPKKFKKKIPPIPMRKTVGYNSINNSFFFDEINNNNNYNTNNNNTTLPKPKIRYSNIPNENNNLKKNVNYKIIHKKNITECKNNLLLNKTHSQSYLKDMEDMGFRLSFSKRIRKNDSIDLISSELIKDLKRHSFNKKREIIFSDLDDDKVKKNKYNINCNNKLYDRRDIYNEMQKKRIQRLSSYLLKNRKNKWIKNNSMRKEKYDIIDIKEKIKKERRNRTISNSSKFRKKEIVKDNPTATSIRKEDEKGGKVDFIIPSKNTRNKNKKYNIRVGLNNLSNLIINKNSISINAAKTIQKWWRNLLTQFITEFNIINIQSVFRGYLFRKKFKNIPSKIPMDKYRKRENIIKIKFIQKIWREYHISLKKKRKSYIFSTIKNKKKFIYRKSFKQNQNKINNNIFENSNNNSYINNNNYIQQNSCFGIISYKRKESINNRNENENENENENNIDNELIKNDINDDRRNSEFLSLTQIKNDIIEIKGIDDSHIDDDELYKCLKSDYTNDKSNKNKTDNKKNNMGEPLQIKGKNNLKICLFTKKCYKNKGEKSIIFIQKYFRKYLKDKNKNKDENLYLENKEKIMVIPISLFPCFIEKIRVKQLDKDNNNASCKSFKYNFTINNGCNINYSPINKNIDKKYDENQIKMSNEKQIVIVRNIVKENIETSNFDINIKNEKKQSDNLDIQKKQNIPEINYEHDIEFSIKKECIEDIEKIPFIQKCYFSKKNIILIKASPIEYSISKINSEQYNPSSKKNAIFEITNLYSSEFLGKQKTKTEYQISQSINDNYITSSLNNNKNNDKDENKDLKRNNYLISYSFSEFKATKNDKNLYEICTINTNIINSQRKSNDKYKKLEIDNQNNTLNYNITKTESILKMPFQVRNYFTKENNIIDNYCKSKERNKIILLNQNCDISKDDINKEDKTNKEEILKYPIKNSNCFISKNYMSNKNKKIVLIQKRIKKMINQRKIKSESIYMRQIKPNYLITKVFKDDSSEKIILIQKYFKKYKNQKKIDDNHIKLEDYNNKVLNGDIKNTTDSNSKNCIDNIYNNDSNNIICDDIISGKNITDKSHENNNDIDRENYCSQKKMINNIKVKENNYKKNIPYKKDNDKILNLKDKVKIKIENNYNEVTNEQNTISYKYTLNGRNIKDDNDTYINSFQKNSHSFENVTTSYGTNDNFNFNLNKARTSYNMIEKSQNTFEQKTVINIQENKNSYESSYKIINYNKTEYEKNEVKRKEENQRYNEISNYTQTAYQINVFKDEERINILKNKIKQYYIRNILNKIRKKIDYKKMIYVVQMIIQRIKKNLNQYTFQRIKIYNSKNKSQPMNSDSEFMQKSFFFNTIKRHLKINKVDNNLESNNEVVILLRKNIPYFFMNNHKKNFIPYINQKQEKNLINNDIFLFDDDKLSNYIYKCYKIEKNLFTITSHIIKNRLIKNPLRYQNLFSITRYMDNLHDDLNNGNICQKCYCKKNELCLIGCHCHDNNFMMKNNINTFYRHSYAYNNNNYNLKKEKEKEKEKEKKKNKKFEILKRFSESNEPSECDISRISNTNEMNYYNYYNNHTVNYTTYNTNTNNENIDKSNFQHEHRGSKKINNFIKNFTLRKKMRNSISSNVSNISDEIEDKKMLKYNTNSNNLKEKSINHLNQIIDNNQKNNYEEDIKVDKSEGIKKINNSLYKKKINKIIPMSKSNRNSNIISKLNEFRTRQSESRKKNKEIIKLRDDFYYDNEIYENI